MARRRNLLLAAMTLALTACGTEPPRPAGDAAGAQTMVDVRVLSADLARGASLGLEPAGRAVFHLGHIGGGSMWLGTWAEDGDTLTILLPRKQVRMITSSAPEDVDPPEQLVLRRAGEDTWIETRRTIGGNSDQAMTWHEEIVPTRRAALAASYRFATVDEHDEHSGETPMLDADLLELFKESR